MLLDTVGHGTLPAEAFTDLLLGAHVEQLVDIRSYPGSRHNPQFNREAMDTWLVRAGLRYAWLPELGGRRRPQPGSRHVALRNDAFRGYADHMETTDFAAGVERLLEECDRRPTVVMCSESVWWRCHRRLLADHLVLIRGIDVVHLMHDGRLTTHPVTDGARRDQDHVVYDVGATPSLDLPDH